MPKKTGFFSCTDAHRENIEISLRRVNPITKIPKLTDEKLELIDKLQVSNEEKQLLKDMFNNGKILFKNFEKIDKKGKFLLSKIKGMTKLIDEQFINEEKIKDTTENLKELIEEYKTESALIDWSMYSSLSSQCSIAPEIPAATSIQSPKLVETQVASQPFKSIYKEETQQNNQPTQKNKLLTSLSPEILVAASVQSLSLTDIQTAKLQLKPISKDKVQEHKEITQPIVLDVGAESQLKPVKPDVIVRNYGVEMTLELAKKLAEQNAKIEKTIDTNILTTIVSDTMTNDIGLSQEATQFLENLQPYLTQEEFDNLEYDLNEKSSENQLDEQKLQEIRNKYCFKIIEPIVNDLKRYLSPEKFAKLDNEISVKNAKHQLNEKTIEEIEIIDDKVFRCSLILEENENRLSLQSMHFKSIDDKDKPIIVETILKQPSCQ